MNVKQLIAQLEREIEEHTTAIADAKDIIARLRITHKKDVDANATGVAAIGDSPKSCIEAWCQSRGMGFPVNVKDIEQAMTGGNTWGKSFSVDTHDYMAYGKEIPGGFAMTSYRLDETAGYGAEIYERALSK